MTFAFVKIVDVESLHVLLEGSELGVTVTK